MEQSPSWEADQFSQLTIKFPAFYGTWSFITAFTSARHLSLSWASPVQPIPPNTTLYWVKLLGKVCCTGMVIMLNIHNRLFDMLCLHTSVFPVYILRSYQKALIAVTKLLQRGCVLRLLSSFNSKLLSSLIPPIFLFLMSSSRRLLLPLISFPNYEKTRHCVCSE
jgi:hypothetical protein